MDANSFLIAALVLFIAMNIGAIGIFGWMLVQLVRVGRSLPRL